MTRPNEKTAEMLLRLTPAERAAWLAECEVVHGADTKDAIQTEIDNQETPE